ncbi:MAG: Fpg/Nei family DNA glycosylase [Acidobacteria bacterium]|nr:Fpg/Nei family DNA glycosylase [Acidobacteriota bacterium]
MPEGHTIRRLASEHERLFAGTPVRVSSPQGRFGDARVVDGAVLEATDAWGKHLFHEYAGGRIVHVHLGLYGTFTTHALPAPTPRETCRMRIVGDDAAVDLVGATICELLDGGGKAAVLARLGPDPLRPDADPDRAWQSLRRRRIPVGQALLDQSVVAGVGNVYRAEALKAHGIHPLRQASSITEEEWRALWRTLVRLLRKGVREGRISGRTIYRLDACQTCGAPVRRWDLAGRWAYACETCQPL